MPRLPVRSDENGFMMVVSVILLSVVASLGAIVMVSGNHSSQTSARGRSWVQALHVAESGIQDAMVRMQSTGTPPASFSGTTQEGSFSVTVTSLGRSRYRLDSVGSVGLASLRARRKIRVTLSPPSSFNAALFSYTSIDTKNNDHIVGDVWANQNVIVDNNDLVEGAVTGATGYVLMRNGSRVTKNVQAGGYDTGSTSAVYVDTNGKIDGSATGSVTAPTDPVTCGGEDQAKYTIKLMSGAVVGGSTKTWGQKQGAGTVGGTIQDHVCTAAPAARSLPTYSYAAANYPATTLHEFGTPSAPTSSALSDFTTYLNTGSNRTNLTGTFTIFQTGTITQATRIDLSGAVVTGDLTLVSNVPIYTASISDAASVTDAIVLLASYYRPPAGSVCDVNKDSSDCAIHAKNNFSTSGATAVLVYAPAGPVAVKNNQDMFGAVYADNIQIKNNQTLTYDARVDRLVGFGPVTLEPSGWMELPAF